MIDARLSALFPVPVSADAAFGQARLLYLWQ
jgi:hypothetical protein